MNPPLDIYQIGHPILRQVAGPVANPKDPQIQALIDRAMAAAFEKNGVGIAAPQIGQSYRFIIIASRPNLRYPNAPTMEPTALINPKILSHSDTQVKGWEGCLSVPGVRGFVPRFTEIEVEYTDRNGELKRQVFTDFVARIFQHEYDHLEGYLFTDRVTNSEDLISESEYMSRFPTGS